MDALLTVVKDPDNAEKFLDKKWNQLPSGFERDMMTEGIKIKKSLYEKIKNLSTEQKAKLKEKLVFYTDKKGRKRRFDTDPAANRRYRRG